MRGYGARLLTPTFLLEACWLTVAFLTPSLFNPASIRVFEPEKVAFIQSAAILMVALWAVQAALRTGNRAPTGTSPAGAGSYKSGTGSQSSVISPWRLELPIGALVACYVLAAPLSDLPGASFLGSYRRQFGAITYLSFAAIALVVSAQLRSSSQARRLLLAIALGALVPSLYAVVQKLGLDPIPWSVDNSRRVVGTLGQPTYLGAYLAAAMPATVWLLARSKSMRWRSALTLLLALQLLALLFSQSRAAWAGAAAGLLVVAPFHDMGRLLGQRGRRIVLGSVGVVLVFLVAINLPGASLNGFARSVPYLERLASVSDFESGSGKVRAVIWQALPALISERPILGQGPDMMGYAFERHYPPELAYAENRTASADEAHNVLLQQLVSVGVLGLLAFLWLLAAVFRQLPAIRRESSVISYQSSALSPGYVAIAGIVAWLVEGMAGVPSASAYLLFWLYLGLVAAMARMSEANTSLAGDGVGDDREGTMRGKGTAISRRRPPGARVVRWGAATLVMAVAVVEPRRPAQ